MPDLDQPLGTSPVSRNWPRSLPLQLCCAGLGYFLCASVSGYFATWAGLWSFFWLPAGWYLGLLIITPKRHWLHVVVATGLADAVFNVMGNPWPLSYLLIGHLGNSASAVLGAYLIERFVARPPTFAKIRELGWTIILGGALALLISASIGAALMVLANPSQSYGVRWLQWYAMDLLGVILLTPLMLVWTRSSPTWSRDFGPRFWVEGLALMAGMLITLSASFLYSWPKQAESIYLAMPFVIWSGIRFGRHGATLVILVAATITHVYATHGYGAIGSSTLSDFEKSAEMLVSIGVFTFVGLLPAIVYAAQRQSEARTRESEERYALAAQGSSAGIFDWDITSGAVYTSERCRQLLDYGPEHADAFPRDYGGFKSLIHSDDLGTMLTAMEDHFADPTAPFSVDLRMIPRAGEARWFTMRAAALCHPGERPHRLAGSIVDVTDRKNLEAQLQQAGKMELIGQLAGGVAHDFNNILAAMMLNLEMLEIDLPPEDENDATLTDLRALTKRAAKLTEQLLMFARRRHIEPKVFELNASLQECARMLQRLIPENIDFAVFFHPTELRVSAEASLIDQVVINICINACDAMPAGGRLRLSTSLVNYHTAIGNQAPESRDGDFCCIRIADNGHGMPPETIDRIFEPFFTTKEPGHGTGLGLASSHGIIVQHGGWIELDSTVGKGTEFRVYLPQCDLPPAETALANPEPIRTGTERVLLVEDDDSVRRASASIVRSLGYVVIEAPNADQALQLWNVQSGRFDLLLTDMVMPGRYSGLELGRRLRERQPQLKVLLSSGYSSEIMNAEALEEKDFAFIAKPFDRRTLANSMRALLD
ncbi:MASE1 domain-containing protein [Synoicihabitans lomoniglobus]|uniref:histidine kinase n=1 Tax=Synoicihabitans lomoniglobus TaxID=2909285 RepID=A0AAE9ZXG5_9BACT|nr:MASE1 domain-containing protein [Opitutaceae bacterium LMO-M01]WED65049.1 MASE1 domain-containing protein [Opitutaceae bacterium LMO-M01]